MRTPHRYQPDGESCGKCSFSKLDGIHAEWLADMPSVRGIILLAALDEVNWDTFECARAADGARWREGCDGIRPPGWVSQWLESL